MNEYTDIRKKKHKVTQTVRESKESREIREKEIVKALLNIFRINESSK